jgi:ABC-type transport system substrate-binding protein
MRRAGYHRAGGKWLTNTGHQLSLSLAVPTDDRWAITAAQNVVSQLSASGVAVRVITAPGSFETAALLRSGQVQLGIVVRTTGPLPAQSASWFSLSPGPPASNVWAGFSTEGIDELATGASKIMNPSTAGLTYGQIDQALWSALPAVPLFTEPYLLAWSSDVAGVTSNPYPPGSLASLPTWQVASPSS